jgi:hypothetical protein
MTDWRPIETAPKDGSIIRVKIGDKGEECTATWCNSWCAPLFSFGGRMPGGISFNYDHQPTHWREQSEDDWTADQQKHERDRSLALRAMGTGRIK